MNPLRVGCAAFGGSNGEKAYRADSGPASPRKAGRFGSGGVEGASDGWGWCDDHRSRHSPPAPLHTLGELTCGVHWARYLFRGLGATRSRPGGSGEAEGGFQEDDFESSG